MTKKHYQMFCTSTPGFVCLSSKADNHMLRAESVSKPDTYVDSDPSDPYRLASWISIQILLRKQDLIKSWIRIRICTTC